MGTNLYLLRAKFLLTPVWHDDPPEIIVGLDESIIYAGKLFATTAFNIDQQLELGEHSLWVEFTNKKDSDTQGKLDKAVIVDSVIFNDISDPKFVWEGMYQPCYPEPWASQQNNLQPILKSHNYLGWNGKWTLTFDAPIFTWIHKTQNLGWIYD